MDEKRKFSRVSYSEPVAYRVSIDRSDTGCLGHDISSGGLRCTVNDFIPLGQELQLTVHLKRDELVELTGRVVWVKRMAHSENYQVGLRFLEVGGISSLRQRVDNFIEESRGFS